MPAPLSKLSALARVSGASPTPMPPPALRSSSPLQVQLIAVAIAGRSARGNADALAQGRRACRPDIAPSAVYAMSPLPPDVTAPVIGPLPLITSISLPPGDALLAAGLPRRGSGCRSWPARR
jgi:hypothetical protein